MFDQAANAGKKFLGKRRLGDVIVHADGEKFDTQCSIVRSR